ncbi:MAG: hypothetical protein ACLPQS_14120 [Acidimicrobiales bacterium]
MTTARSPVSTASSVDRLLAGIEAGAVPRDAFCDDAVLDATVPNWRFRASGGEAVHAELAKWFADPGHFEELRRFAIDDGELVEFTLAWQEGGVAHACHQAHLLRMRDGLVASDTAFCGGRWPARLLAEMSAAQ